MGRYDQDESGARDVSEEMDSFNMKGRGDDATLTERQVKRLSARQVRVFSRAFTPARYFAFMVRVACEAARVADAPLFRRSRTRTTSCGRRIACCRAALCAEPA
jgi:hypothetical protein